MTKKFDKIYHRLEIEEPNSCEYPNCKEQLNGLHHYWIYLSKNYCFDCWLCGKHSRAFCQSILPKDIMEVSSVSSQD